MMIVLLAEHASMSVLLKQYLKETSIRLIRMYALTVELALMFVLLRLFIPHSIAIYEMIRDMPWHVLFYFYWGPYLAFSRIPCTSVFLIISSILIPGFFIIYDSIILKPSQMAACPGDSFVK
jgi:hypothetical protein